MIKISAISYLNSIPFIYGLRNSQISKIIDLQLDYPANCAKKIISGDVQLALAPVAIIPNLKESYIISDYCIGAKGAVDTVCLYSDVPIDKIDSIFLDYQSKTSVELLKILLREYWKFHPKLITSNKGFEGKINSENAALVIGDRAFDLNKKHQYVYDLSAIWYEMTGFPFVFAAWVSNIKLSDSFVNQFTRALCMGVNNIDLAIENESVINLNNKCQSDYINSKISYTLDAEKIKGMELFFEKLI
jgi:chorismate dehydratase